MTLKDRKNENKAVESLFKNLAICPESGFSLCQAILIDTNHDISLNNIDDEFIEDEMNLNECLKNNRLVIANNDSVIKQLSNDYTVKNEVKNIDKLKKSDKKDVGNTLIKYRKQFKITL